MRVLARIQGHPSRAHLHQPLADSIGLPTEVMLHSSDPPNPWAGYQACLSNLPDADHIVVIQDDAFVAPGFGEKMTELAAEHPDHPLVLFLSWLPRRISVMAQQAYGKEPYVETVLRQNEFCPVVGVLWPTHKAREFLEWTAANHRRLPRDRHNIARSDDGVMGRWSHYAKQPVRFTVPSLVQHPDDQPSTIGKKPHWGRDRNRVALFW